MESEEAEEFKFKEDISDKAESKGGKNIDGETQKLNIDTMGGDAALLHLISLVDNGIKYRVQFKSGARAKKFRRIYVYCKPFKFFMIFIYAMMTQLEQPAFCVHLLKSGNVPNFSGKTCSTPDDIYTHFDLMDKFEPAVTRPLEAFILISLVIIQWIHNQYREFDFETKWAWRCHLAITVWSIGSMILNSIFFSVQAYSWGSAFCRPLLLIALFTSVRQYFQRYLKVIYDSLPMVIFIYGFVIYYAWLG